MLDLILVDLSQCCIECLSCLSLANLLWIDCPKIIENGRYIIGYISKVITYKVKGGRNLPLGGVAFCDGGGGILRLVVFLAITDMPLLVMTRYLRFRCTLISNPLPSRIAICLITVDRSKSHSSARMPRLGKHKPVSLL